MRVVHLLWVLAAGAVDVTVTNQPVHTISPSLYGIFFEEINFAGEGGLFAELIRNRDLEALGRGNLGQHTDGCFNADPIYSSFVPWTAGGATIATDNTTQPFPTNPTTLRVQFAGFGNVMNPGYWGINCAPGLKFNLTFFAKASAPVQVTPSLQTTQGGVVATGAPVLVTGGWSQYSTTITGNALEQQAQFVLSATSSSTLWLDAVSLRPQGQVAGLFRADLFQRLRDLKPAFVRFPGGNYLEGDDQATRWDWKATIGRIEARAGHYNSAWNYWSSDGLGLYEYLMLCELLNAEPQMSIYTGYSMRTGYVPLNESQPFAQDALDALEFANGDASTKYGALRVAMGHALPFNLNRLEVGNEEVDMDGYASHYKLITSQIWAKYPEVQIVASGCWKAQNVGVCQPGNPCTSGQRCDAWDDHLYECPDVMAQQRSAQYDNYNRSSPKVFKGEFAANAPSWLQCADVPPQGPALQNLQASLAEAAYMMGFERNADVVLTSSFAPLFCNSMGTQWPYNLINFNSASSFGIPSFHLQTIFSQYLGQRTLTVATSAPVGNVAGWVVASQVADGTVFLKLLNYSPQPMNVTVNLAKFPAFTTVVSSVQLTHADRLAVNSFESPLNVSPEPGPEPLLAKNSFNLTMSAWSLTALALR